MKDRIFRYTRRLQDLMVALWNRVNSGSDVDLIMHNATPTLFEIGFKFDSDSGNPTDLKS